MKAELVEQAAKIIPEPQMLINVEMCIRDRDYDFWSFGKDGDSDLKDQHAPENEDDIGNLPKF